MSSYLFCLIIAVYGLGLIALSLGIALNVKSFPRSELQDRIAEVLYGRA